MRKLILLLRCAFVLGFAAIMWGQPGTGTLSGRVTTVDGTGISNAAVTITNVNNNTSQNVLTAPDGSFAISGLVPGTYRLEVVTAGYKRTTQQDVVLLATGSTVSITLERGSINETVEIKGHSPTVQTQGGEVSVAIGNRTIRELPVVDRNHQQLVELQTGITPPTPAIDMARDPDRNRFFSANGQSPATNIWEQDALLNEEPFRGTAIRVSPSEAVRQMNIETDNFTPNGGFAGGAIVTSLTSTGTNDIHGSLFEFNSGNWSRARDFFNVDGNPNPRFVYNQMGATIGAPIVRDRTFFFGSYEGTYANGGQTEVNTVPTAAIASGNFGALPGFSLYSPFGGTATGTGRTPFAGNVIPAGEINPTSAVIVAALPSPNAPGFVNNYISNVPFRNHANKADARIDQHFGDHTAVVVRYGYTNAHVVQSSPLGDLIGSGVHSGVVGQNAVLDVSHDVTSGLIMNVRLGYNRYDQHLDPLNSPSGLGSSLMGINIPGFPSIGTLPYVPSSPVDNTLNGVLNFGWHTSRHDFRFGTDDRAIRSDRFTDTAFGNLFGPNGTAYFGPGATLLNNGAPLSLYGAPYNSFAAFLLGAPSQIGAVNYFVPPSIRQTQYSFWVGDRMQFMRRFTLDLGVRYELYSPLSASRTGGAAFFNPTDNTFSYAGLNGVSSNSGLWNTNAVAPRVGIAASITPKTVFRAGYAWHYFQLPYMYSGFMGPAFGNVLGTQGTYAIAPLTTPFDGTFSAGLPPASLQNGTPAGNLPATVVPRSMRTPYIQTYSGQLQQEFYWGTTLSVGYMGSTGRFLPFVQELNTALPGSPVSALPFFALGRTANTLLYSNGLTNNYNSLQASLAKRFTGGISFDASYTYSKALGYTTANNFLLNPFNRSLDYGPLDYDRQSVLTLSHLWELPFGGHGNSLWGTIAGGWQLNGIFTWATGTPLTLTADPLSCGCVNGSVLASIFPGANPVLNQGTSFLNPAAFTAPPGNEFGNLGRGAIRGPGFRNYDFSLFKNFHVHDRFNLQLRGEAYNLTNTPRFNAPVSNINSPDFGQTVTTVNGAFGRQINIALRVLW